MELILLQPTLTQWYKQCTLIIYLKADWKGQFLSIIALAEDGTPRVSMLDGNLIPRFEGRKCIFQDFYFNEMSVRDFGRRFSLEVIALQMKDGKRPEAADRIETDKFVVLDPNIRDISIAKRFKLPAQEIYVTPEDIQSDLPSMVDRNFVEQYINLSNLRYAEPLEETAIVPKLRLPRHYPSIDQWLIIGQDIPGMELRLIFAGRCPATYRDVLIAVLIMKRAVQWGEAPWLRYYDIQDGDIFYEPKLGRGPSRAFSAKGLPCRHPGFAADGIDEEGRSYTCWALWLEPKQEPIALFEILYQQYSIGQWIYPPGYKLESRPGQSGYQPEITSSPIPEELVQQLNRDSSNKVSRPPWQNRSWRADWRRKPPQPCSGIFRSFQYQQDYGYVLRPTTKELEKRTRSKKPSPKCDTQFSCKDCKTVTDSYLDAAHHVLENHLCTNQLKLIPKWIKRCVNIGWCFICDSSIKEKSHFEVH